MPITRKRFHGPAQVSNAAATKYTVPANTKAIVRHIHVFNPGSGSVNFTLSIGTDAAGTRVFDAKPVAEDESLDHFCYYILEETEIIQALGSVTNQLVLIIDGEESTP